MSDIPEDLVTFSESFDGRSGHCRLTCECGKTFYDGVSPGYSWEEGELEALNANPAAQYLDCSVSTIWFEGSTYVWQCNCWHKRARAIKGFMDAHAHSIAEYLTREKRRKQAEADRAPVVAAD